MSHDQMIQEIASSNGFFVETLFQFFPKTMKRLCDIAMIKKTQWLEFEEAKKKIQYQNMEMDRLVGCPVIAFGNNNSNPVVGFIVRYEKVSKADIPVPVIRNYINGQELLCMAPVFPFTMQRMRLAETLTGEQIWSLLIRYSDCDFDYTPNEKTGTKNHEFHGHDVLHNELIRNGFISKYHQHLENVQEAELKEMLSNSRP